MSQALLNGTCGPKSNVCGQDISESMKELQDTKRMNALGILQRIILTRGMCSVCCRKPFYRKNSTGIASLLGRGRTVAILNFIRISHRCFLSVPEDSMN